MKNAKQDNDARDAAITKPYTMVGAGKLASTIWKSGDEYSGWRYRFNIFRMTARDGRVSQQFFPSDVIQLVKLTRVLATVLDDDGCLPLAQRRMLRRMAFFLDDFLRSSEENAVPTVQEVDALTRIIERLPASATSDHDLRVVRDWLRRATSVVGDNP